jgi:hypothetical protein
VIPYFIVPKKGDGARLVVDGRETNAHFASGKFGLPNAKSILTMVGTWYAKIDLRSAFTHADMDPESSEYFLIRHPNGELFKFRKMIFGTNFAPEIQQKLVEPFCNALKDHFNQRIDAQVYLDDFVIQGNDKQVVAQAIVYLKALLAKNGFQVKESKSSQQPEDEVEWNGFRVKN